MLVQLSDEAYPMANAAGMTIRLSVQSEPIMVNADPDKLARALQNLLRNAVSYGQKRRYFDFCTSGEKNSAPFLFPIVVRYRRKNWNGSLNGFTVEIRRVEVRQTATIQAVPV